MERQNKAAVQIIISHFLKRRLAVKIGNPEPESGQDMRFDNIFSDRADLAIFIFLIQTVERCLFSPCIEYVIFPDSDIFVFLFLLNRIASDFSWFRVGEGFYAYIECACVALIIRVQDYQTDKQ